MLILSVILIKLQSYTAVAPIVFALEMANKCNSSFMVCLPAYLGDQRVYLMSDIVPLDIPLLFSRCQ